MAVLKKIIIAVWDRSSTLFISSQGELNIKMGDPSARSREAYFSTRDEQVSRF